MVPLLAVQGTFDQVFKGRFFILGSPLFLQR